MKVLIAGGIYREHPDVMKTWFNQSIAGGNIDVFIQRARETQENNFTVNYNYQMIQSIEHAKAGNYDYLLVVSDDILLCDNAVQMLIDSDKPIVSGIHRLFAHKAGQDHLMCRIVDHAGEQCSDDRYITTEDFKNYNGLVKATQFDLNCLMMRRDFFVREDLMWYGEPKICRNLTEIGVDMWCNTDVRNGHYHMGYPILEV